MQKIAVLLLILIFGVPLSSAFADSAPTGFTNPVKVSLSGDNSTVPQLVVSGSDVYLGWIDNTAGKFGAKLAKSDDDGYSFGQEIDLKNVNAGAPDNIKITVFGNNVYSVWQSFAANKSSIAFAKSQDNGTTFSSPIQISSPAKDSAFPQIAVYDNNVYVVWLDRNANDETNVIFVKSSDGGATFGAPIEITSHAGNSGIPKLYANANNVYLMWEDNGDKNFDVFLSTSNDSGNTFGTPVNISNNAGDSGAPQMAVSGNSVYATWMDDTSGNFEIMFSKSNDGGKTFTEPIDLSGDAQDSGYSQITASGSSVYVVWTNGVKDKNYDIFFAKSDDGGKTFDQPLNISNSLGASGWPQIAVDGNVYVSWVDNSSGNFNVYIVKSTDNGNSFESPVDVNSNLNGSWSNAMAISPNVVYLAWQEGDNKNSQIMFSKSTTFVPEFGPIASLVLVIATMSLVVISKSSMLKSCV